MALVVNTNATSSLVQRNLAKANAAVNSSIERLATGYKINKAADNAAGLAIAQTFKTQSSGTLIAEENAQHGVNLLQTADGDLGTIHENLQRVRDLVLQASNDTYSASERAMITSEVTARVEEINRVANASKFSNINLLNGSSSNITLQVGANSGADSQLNIGGALIKSTATALNANFTASAITTALASASTANAFIANVDAAITKVSNARSSIGTYQNRLSSTLDSLSVRYENMSSSLSTIQDTDIASETANLTKAQILQQISSSLLSTANQNPSIVLNLL